MLSYKWYPSGTKKQSWSNFVSYVDPNAVTAGCYFSPVKSTMFMGRGYFYPRNS